MEDRDWCKTVEFSAIIGVLTAIAIFVVLHFFGIDMIITGAIGKAIIGYSYTCEENLPAQENNILISDARFSQVMIYVRNSTDPANWTRLVNPATESGAWYTSDYEKWITKGDEKT